MTGSGARELSRVGARAAEPAAADARELAVNLIAVLVATDEERPRVLTVGGDALPSGPFATAHRSLQAGMRDWIERQTHQPIGYVEQLYTFADRDRGDDPGARMVSISYLGLTREGLVRAGAPARASGGASGRETAARDTRWVDWYAFFPWEDRRRAGQPAEAAPIAALEAALLGWAEAGGPGRAARRERCAINFGLDGHGWNEELVLQRYELLFEAGLIPEACRATAGARAAPGAAGLVPGRRMTGDHRRILATGLARLRAKIKYRPVVFELLAPAFTLTQLQRSVEALAGRLLHKQNFRRLIEGQNLVEETGAVSIATGGRPAKLYRFRRDVLAEREVAGTKLPLAGG